MPPRISLVVPAHNEQAFLPQLLDSIDAAREAYRGDREAIEVIVADNASTDETAKIAVARGCRLVSVPKRVIAAARNGGAATARGELIAFVDADSRIHPETFNALEDALSNEKIVGGASGVSFDRWSFGLAATYAFYLPLVWLTRFDTGVVFCRRRDFEEIGGYNEVRLFGEDVQFMWELRRLGRSRRQRLFRATSAKAITSTRKFDRYGDWHYFPRVVWLAGLLLTAPGASTRFARQYWYGDRR
jgi:glycosyltransferase involved in cell wall biosynthesis